MNRWFVSRKEYDRVVGILGEWEEAELREEERNVTLGTREELARELAAMTKRYHTACEALERAELELGELRGRNLYLECKARQEAK